jgi:hypothetical protein
MLNLWISRRQEELQAVTVVLDTGIPIVHVEFAFVATSASLAVICNLERPAVFLDARQRPPASQQSEGNITIAVTHPLR